MSSILIVDDEIHLRQSFERLLLAEGYTVYLAANHDEGLHALKTHSPDLVIMDVRMPGADGITTLNDMRVVNSHVPIIIMTAYSSTGTAIEAIKNGAYDYILKPFDIPNVLTLIQTAIETSRLSRQQVQLGISTEEPNIPSESLLGSSKPMQEIYKAIGRVAPTDSLVLIRGESGTGKELIARALFQHSLRANNPFQIINCVAIPESLLESELFGYERGAFTGANLRHIGKIEQAEGGTVFLDEIGDIPLSIQAKLLRLLQEKEIERLGGRQVIPVDVRIIAATNANLEAAVANSTFREDLYYRLRVVTLSLPTLRERSGDINELTQYFMNKYAHELDMPNPGINKEALNFLEQQSWPGNVRELENAIHKALIFNRGLPLSVTELQNINAQKIEHTNKDITLEHIIATYIPQRLSSSNDPNLFESLMDEFGQAIVSQALTLTEGNRTRASKLLGLSRPTLIAKIDKYNLKK